MWLNRRRYLLSAAAVIASTASAAPTSAVSYPEYMLHLINIERDKAGVAPVELGTNMVAQIHADNMVSMCFLSHWGVDGLKPYMRYSLCGGYQVNSENVYGVSSCFLSPQTVGSSTRGPVALGLHKAMTAFLSSAGHRGNILNPDWRKVNIGIAADAYNLKLVQHFEADYVELEEDPALDGRVLTMNGRVKDGISIDSNLSFYLSVDYEPPPHILTLGQLLRSAAYGAGQLVAAYTAPGTEGQIGQAQVYCGDPYMVEDDVAVAANGQEAIIIRSEVKRLISQCEKQATSVQASDDALHWFGGNDRFSVQVDLSAPIREHGRGVYTVDLVTTEDTPFFSHSFFYGITPPEGYR